MQNTKTALALILTFALLAAGCANAPNSAGDAKKTAGKIRIGLSMATLKEERWQKDKDFFEARAKEVGAEVSVQVADNDEAKQSNQVDNLLTQGLDVLVIIPHNAQTAASMVERAKAQGVPVISYDRLIASDQVDLYVSHQISRVGQMQAEYALKHAPKGNYIMVYGASTDNNSQLIKEAQAKVLHDAVAQGDIKLVAEQNAKDWSPAEAQKIVENALTQNNNNVVAVVAANDGTAGGSIEALAAQGLAGKVVVTGQDADIAALQRIVEGKQSMTVYKPIKPLAYGAVDAAVKLAKKEKPDTNAALKAVNKEVPSMLYDPLVVDKSNVLETVVKDGYQKFDDIYKNVPPDQRPKPTARLQYLLPGRDEETARLS